MLSFSNTNNNEYLKKGEAKQTYVQKIIYNSDTTEIENDISNLETRMTTAEGNITTNTNNISTNTLNINNLSASVGTNTSDISNLKSRMTTAESNITNLSSSVTTNSSNISTNTSDISNLKTRMTTAEGRITTNTNNISNLQTQINNLNLGSPYEGLFYSRYNGNYIIVEFNYNIGNMLLWPDQDFYVTPINNVDTTNHVELSSDIETIILPGTIKK